MEKKLKHSIAQLFIVLVLSILTGRPAVAHNGVDHDKSCFLDVGDTRLQLSGYQFRIELEAKHYCHFFPELGQTVLSVEPVAEVTEPTTVTLELAELTSWTKPARDAYAVIKSQPARPLGPVPVTIIQTLEHRGLYRLNVTLQNAAGSRQQQLWFMAGVPVTKIMIMIALGLLSVLAVFGVREFVKKR